MNTQEEKGKKINHSCFSIRVKWMHCSLGEIIKNICCLFEYPTRDNNFVLLVPLKSLYSGTLNEGGKSEVFCEEQ